VIVRIEYHEFGTVEKFYDTSVTRTKIDLSGSYSGKDGHFEWIIEADNVTVRHRLFVPKE
jgi:hypothetical protein